MLSLALMLVSQHWLIIIIGVLAIALIYIDTIRIDRHEIVKFGDEYRRYMQTVPSMNALAGFIRLLRRRRGIQLEAKRQSP